jgi:hypothetical protein
MSVRAFPRLKTWFECVEERDAEIARLRAVLLEVKYGAEYEDALGDKIDAALANKPPV